MPFVLLRAYCWLNRFRSLPLAQKAFRGVKSPMFVKRRLFGGVIDLDVSRSTAQQLLLLEGERFVAERFLIGRLLRRGMTVVDVGANIGYYLLLFQQHIGHSGKVICIEPSIENLPELERTIDINHFANTTVHAVALGAIEGEAELHTGINSGIVVEGAGAYTVPLRRLDHLVTGPVDFLKIDVEGYEGQVLEGAAALIQAHRPRIFLEVHPHIVRGFGFTTARILDWLASYYRKISLFETRSRGQRLRAKVAERYLGRDAVLAVNDPKDYVALHDPGDVAHTFWAVCEP